IDGPNLYYERAERSATVRARQDGMIDATHPLLLGSRSPRRRELLELLGLPLRIAGAAVDETAKSGEDADRYLERIALAKLGAIAESSAALGVGAVIVADTIVLLERVILGKPDHEADAARMIRALAGNVHEVWTRFAIALPNSLSRAAHAETVRTRV